MKFPLLFLTLSLFVASCRASGDREEPTAHEQRLIDLLRQGDYSKAAEDSDHIGQALVFHIRELREKKASAEAILRACDFYFSHYPFAIGEIAVNIDRLEDVALTRADAALRTRTPDEVCLGMEKIQEFGQAYTALESFPKNHHDGGRCALHFYRILRETTRGGPGWSKASTLPGASTLVFEDEAYWLKYYFERTAHSFDDAFVLLGGLRVGEFRRSGGLPATDAFWLEELAFGRWARLFESYFGWLRALELPPNVYALERTGRILSESDGSSVLRRLGKALVTFNERYENCRSKKENPALLEKAAQDVIELAGLAPFSDQIRFAVISVYIEREELAQSERVFRRYLGERALGPDHASYALYWMGQVSAERAPDRARGFYEEAGRYFPTGAAIPYIRLELANLCGKPEDRIQMFKSLMEAPPLETLNPRSRTTEDARSEAARALALYYQDQKEWAKSLSIWQSWTPRSWCATCEGGLGDQRELNMGRCLEELGQIDKAMFHYWNVAPNEIKAAQRLKDLHERSGTLPVLRKMIVDKIEKLKAEGKEDLSRNEGLEWLRGTLLRP